MPTPFTVSARALCAGALLLAATGHNRAEPSPIEQAHRAYHFAQYEQSLALYEQLAAQGDAEAAERAGYMLMQGPGAYGPRVPRDVPRATAWLEQAAHAGRPHAGFLLGLTYGTD
jgi:TPR repeat protein